MTNDSRRAELRSAIQPTTRRSGRSALSTVTDAIEYWHGLLRPDVELTPAVCGAVHARSAGGAAALRRPRALPVPSSVLPRQRPGGAGAPRGRDHRADGGARRARRARADGAVRCGGPHRRRTRAGGHRPRLPAIASTASRLDSFILPDSLQFAEYNAESPAGLGYTEVLSGSSSGSRFCRDSGAGSTRAPTLMAPMLDALHRQLSRLGRHGRRPRSRSSTAATCRRGPSSRSCRRSSSSWACRPSSATRVTCDSRTTGSPPDGQAIDLVYRRVLINDILSRATTAAR